MTLRAEDVRVGKTFRARRPRRVYRPMSTGKEYNDRTVLWVNHETGRVQYDGPAVAFGRLLPNRPELWAAGLGVILAKADAGTLRRPLESHGLLRKIAYEEADKRQEQEQRDREAELRRERPRRQEPPEEDRPKRADPKTAGKYIRKVLDNLCGPGEQG